jgi:hypothetical protein
VTLLSSSKEETPFFVMLVPLGFSQDGSRVFRGTKVNMKKNNMQGKTSKEKKSRNKTVIVST